MRPLAALAAAAALALGAASAPAAGDAPPGGPEVTPKTAQAAYASADWREAARQYGILAARPGASPGLWLRLGYARHRLGGYAEAEEAYGKALAAPALAATAHYNIACCRARRGEGAGALESLGRSLDAGFFDALLMEGDEDLASLRREAAWGEAVRRARAARDGVPRRQLDFWVGRWEVRDAAGALLGRSEISLRQGGNAVHEAWTDASGGTGESLNFWDPGLARWRQVWVNDRGAVSEYVGAFEGGAMRFTGRQTGENGQSVVTRLTLTGLEDGRVVQRIENSPDGGRTWTANFEGTYSRRP